MNQKAVGGRIKAAREKKRLTQEQLAELVDLSPMHVSVIERGVKLPKLETLINIPERISVESWRLSGALLNQQNNPNVGSLRGLPTFFLLSTG